jgi:hypothetical protein
MVRAIFIALLLLVSESPYDDDDDIVKARSVSGSDVPPPDYCDEIGLEVAKCMKENAKACYPSCSKVDSTKRGKTSCDNVLDFSCPMNNCCEPCADIGSKFILCQTTLLGCPTDCLGKEIPFETLPSV